MSQQIIETVDRLFGERSTSVAKDLKLNIRRLVDESTLAKEEATLLVIALSKSLEFTELLQAAREAGLSLGLSDDIIQEAQENAAIMGMLNIYYRTRHFIEHHDEPAKEEYGAAKLRMTSLANPAMGKERFELLAFAVSCINGCEMCVTSHEKALMHLGVTRDKLHDVIRLAATMKGLRSLV
jgi:alkyl hydroperoxide reductase subunit D